MQRPSPQVALPPQHRVPMTKDGWCEPELTLGFGDSAGPKFLEFFAVPAWPPCHKQVTFWPGHYSQELALGHTVALDIALSAASELRAYTGPSSSCSLPPSLPSALSSLLSVAWRGLWRGLRRRGTHCCGLRRCAPPPLPLLSQSRVATQALYWKQLQCSNIQAPLGVCTWGESRVSRE